MKSRKDLYLLLVILTLIPLLVVGVALYVSYRAALSQQSARLEESATRQAHLIEVLIEKTQSPALAQDVFLTAHKRFREQAVSREMVVARREGDRIVFIFNTLAGTKAESVPFDGPLGIPMQRALRGEEGSMVSLDYRSVMVVSGYAPVRGVNWGVVVKIDLAEARAPYRNGALLAISLTLVLVLLGAFLFFRTTSPLIRTLEESEARFRGIVQTAQEGIWLLDSQGRLRFVNPQMTRMLGWSESELLGRPWLDIVFEQDRQEAERAWERLKRGVSEQYDIRLRRKDASEFWVLLGATPMLDHNARLTGSVGLITDITERKNAEEQIQQMNQELERRVQQRTSELAAVVKELEAFTYAAAHDLRAPLRHIHGFSNLMREEFGPQLDATAQGYLQRICQGTQRMGNLLEDLLNLSRVGRKELRLQVCGLSSLAQEVMDELQAETRGRQIEWKIGALPFLDCDPGLMKQVIANLLSNAVKFTRPRETAMIEVGQVAVNGESAVFVRDNGVGFSMKYADKLFGVFQRLHRQEDFEGTGVGLATVQRIIQKHGGRVWATAELDKGATIFFTVATPLKSDSQELETALRGGT